MHYINPFNLLNLRSEDLTDSNSAAIRRARNNLLAEIELSDNKNFDYKGIELTKSDCIRVVDELDNKDKREFHFFIAQNADLNSFLTNGDLRFFKNYKIESIYRLPDFLDFISPYFTQQYDKQLSQNYKHQNIVNVKLLLSVNPIASEAYKERCYKGTYTIVKEIENEIIAINKDIADKKSYFIQNKFNGLSATIIEKVNIPLLNILPGYFQALRNSLALNIRNIARDINNEPYEIYESAFEIIQIAHDIETDGLNNQTISKGYYTIKKNYEDSIPQQLTTITQQRIAPKTILTNVDEEVNDKDSETQKIDKQSNGITYTTFLCLVFAIGFFYNPVQKIILGLSLLPLLISIIILYKGKDVSIGGILRKNLLFIVAAMLGFFYPIIAQLFLSYYFLVYIVIIFGLLNHKKREEKNKLGFYHYLIGAILITVLYNNISVNKTLMADPVENKIDSTRTDTSYKSNNSSDTSNTPIDTSTNNNSTKNTTPVSPPKPIFYYPEIKNGLISGCPNISPKYNKKIDNKLIISCGSNADVAVKMINYLTGKCIRYVYVSKNATYTIRNIPQGKYYLKIAYGDNWGVEVGKSICEGRFTTNTLYKKGNDILDYNFVYTGDHYQIPSFSLKLDVIKTDDQVNTFDTNTINENEFYNE